MSSGPAPTLRLVVVDGRMRGAGFEIPPGRSEIGRQAGLAILLDDQDVSRRHAVLDRTGGRVVLADLGSTNGTWVNRRRLRADGGDGVELRDGDEVRVGSVTLRVSLARAASATSTSPAATSTTTTACGSRTTTTPGTSCSAAGGSGGC